MELNSHNLLFPAPPWGLALPLPQPPQEAQASALRILVADDEAVSREILQSICQQLGIRPELATCGRDALERIAQGSLDMVLLDRSLGDMEGLDILGQIRTCHSEMELPVVMVTASDDRKSIIRAFDLGANDYLTKPLDSGIATARIATQMRLRILQRQLVESRERYALAVMGTNDGLWDWNLETSLVYYSPRWQAMLGFPPLEHWANPQHWLARVHPDDRDKVEELLEAHLAGRSEHFETELRLHHESGEFRWMLCRGQAVANHQGRYVRMAGALTDISKGKVVDPLTGLPNRTFFLERLASRLERYARNPTALFAVMYVDLDNFKQINDSYGHASGDQLLIALARALESAVRRADSVIARLGGDEFAILVEQIDSPRAAELIAERVVGVTSAPLALRGGRQALASASIGVALPSLERATPDALLRAADIAMYCAKGAGKAGYRVYHPQMQIERQRRLHFEEELRLAVGALSHRGSQPPFHLSFEPICELATGRVAALHCRLGWHHPEHGDLESDAFLPLAGELGLTRELGQWFREQACAQLQCWRSADRRMQRIRLHVSLSPSELSHLDLPNSLAYATATARLDPHDLILQIAERAIMEHPPTGATVLEKLRHLGVGVSLDDFGIGHSSLPQLHALNFEFLKLGTPFVGDIVGSPRHRMLVEAVVRLAQGMGVQVIAQKIERGDQAELLHQLGCQWGLGPHFSPPLAPHEVVDFVVARS